MCVCTQSVCQTTEQILMASGTGGLHWKSNTNNLYMNRKSNLNLSFLQSHSAKNQYMA